MTSQKNGKGTIFLYLSSLKAIATVEEGDESVVEVVVIEEEEAVQEEGATKVQQRAPAVKSHSNPVTPVRVRDKGNGEEG